MASGSWQLRITLRTALHFIIFGVLKTRGRQITEHALLNLNSILATASYVGMSKALDSMEQGLGMSKVHYFRFRNEQGLSNRGSKAEQKICSQEHKIVSKAEIHIETQVHMHIEKF